MSCTFFLLISSNRAGCFLRLCECVLCLGVSCNVRKPLIVNLWRRRRGEKSHFVFILVSVLSICDYNVGFFLPFLSITLEIHVWFTALCLWLLFYMTRLLSILLSWVRARLICNSLFISLSPVVKFALNIASVFCMFSVSFHKKSFTFRAVYVSMNVIDKY